ncbi:MAG: dual specificity protein phosphatase family protein [Nisaea sp.]|uniref:phosphatase domain-containing protein n=1 Tax=Nisaea sp. TaxID=2024842 RepID=UPI001AFFE10B|nr:dual specificity protein phosphatase family protein [Nisaea sp.]MBO6559934.1 dual specificity protein phosphatase family protein [Nisaea sp.]
MQSLGFTEIPVPGTPGSLFIGPLPADEDVVRLIAEKGFDTVLSLATSEELQDLGTPGLRDAFLSHMVNWTHFPIKDFDIPSAADTRAWKSIETILVERLKHGGQVVIHCRAGFGRSGMIAARLLMACGTEPDEAVHIVRTARPGTIETPAQLDWARSAGAA